MIKIRKIDFIIGAAIVGLLLFFFSATSVNAIFEWHNSEIERVRSEERNARSKYYMALEKYRDQRKRADSLAVINAALSNPEVLWTARALYSETRRDHEMWYLGWVIRNRVEVNFGGKDTYKTVILDDKQFSAFNDGYPFRKFYMTLQPNAAEYRPIWFDAMKAAKRVIEADENRRPFSKSVLFYYSKISMEDGKPPRWAKLLVSVPIRPVKTPRFKFFRTPKIANVK